MLQPIIESILTNEILNISSILNNDIPYNYLNKVEEFNAINGQQQLETFDQVINIIHNKNRADKLESLKRTNIQKGILWCEKNRIPHNKFIDKLNIFLNLSNESKQSDWTNELNIFCN